MLPYERVLERMALAPVGELLGCGIVDDAAQRRLHRVHDAQPFQPLTLVVGEVVVRGIGARELRAAVIRRDHARGEDPGLARDAIERAVDVPLRVALQVLGHRVGGILRDHVDLGDRVARTSHELAEPAAERDLLLVVEVERTEQQHTVRLERVEHRFGHRGIGQQRVVVDLDHLGADCRAQRLRRDRTHRFPFRQRTQLRLRGMPSTTWATMLRMISLDPP